MRNPRITKKEQGLIKGSLRRVFSRSDLRRSVIEAAIIRHSDPSRKAVKTWCLCNECRKPEAKSYMVVDHVLPIVGIEETLDSMSWDELINRLWCDISNLQALCEDCHKIKTKEENAARRKYKKLANNKPVK